MAKHPSTICVSSRWLSDVLNDLGKNFGPNTFLLEITKKNVHNRRRYLHYAIFSWILDVLNNHAYFLFNTDIKNFRAYF